VQNITINVQSPAHVAKVHLIMSFWHFFLATIFALVTQALPRHMYEAVPRSHDSTQKVTIVTDPGGVQRSPNK
jgi:hypothetical protein